MATEWQDLSDLIGDRDVEIERVRLVKEDIAVEGSFALPPLARLTAEDQVFVAAFVRCHGSIKQMEQYFGISYPTVKNRLNRISQRLDFVQIDPPEPNTDVLDLLERGDIDVAEAVRRLKEK
jgi:hypothetical protein